MWFVSLANFMLNLSARTAISRISVRLPAVIQTVLGTLGLSYVIYDDRSSDQQIDSIDVKSSINDIVNSRSNFSEMPRVSEFRSDYVKSSERNLLSVLENNSEVFHKDLVELINSVRGLSEVIASSSFAVVSVLDESFKNLISSIVATSPAVVNTVNPNISNSVKVDTSAIATILEPSLSSISQSLKKSEKVIDKQVAYYDSVLSQNDVFDLDGNKIVSSVNSIDLQKISNAVTSRALTDLNNITDTDIDDDVDIDLTNIDLSKLFNLISLSQQLKNNGNL
ncbi:hypothetical protein [Persephonella sp.]